jgi:hypothetical protein
VLAGASCVTQFFVAKVCTWPQNVVQRSGQDQMSNEACDNRRIVIVPTRGWGRMNDKESKKRIRDIIRRAEGVSMRTTMAGFVYARLARLLRLLRDASGAAIPHSLRSDAASGCSVAAQWETPRRRRAELMPRGVPNGLRTIPPAVGMAPACCPNQSPDYRAFQRLFSI